MRFKFIFLLIVIVFINFNLVSASWDSYSDWYNNYWQPEVVANFAGGHGSSGYSQGSLSSGINQYTQSVVVNSGNYNSNEPIVIINGNYNSVSSYGNSGKEKNPSSDTYSYAGRGFDYYDPYYVPSTSHHYVPLSEPYHASPSAQGFLAVDYDYNSRTYYPSKSRDYSYNSNHNGGCGYNSNYGCNSYSDEDYGYDYNDDLVVTRFDGNCYGDCESDMPPSVYYSVY